MYQQLSFIDSYQYQHPELRAEYAQVSVSKFATIVIGGTLMVAVTVNTPNTNYKPVSISPSVSVMSANTTSIIHVENQPLYLNKIKPNVRLAVTPSVQVLDQRMDMLRKSFKKVALHEAQPVFDAMFDEMSSQLVTLPIVRAVVDASETHQLLSYNLNLGNHRILTVMRTMDTDKVFYAMSVNKKEVLRGEGSVKEARSAAATYLLA